MTVLDKIIRNHRQALLEVWNWVFLALRADERVSDVRINSDPLTVSLRDGRIISVPLAWYPRLLKASPKQRKNWEIAGGGYGIHWPDVDEDLSTEGLLRGAPAAHSSNNASLLRKPPSRNKASK